MQLILFIEKDLHTAKLIPIATKVYNDIFFDSSFTLKKKLLLNPSSPDYFNKYDRI